MDEPREGRPTSVVTEKNVSTVEGLVKQDRRITGKQLASETRITVGSVEKILHDHLNLNKVAARWVPRLSPRHCAVGCGLCEKSVVDNFMGRAGRVDC
ncbi:hypothetical protein EGW08_010218 [Elysia chlorotica]|uniref:Uncharacterized protein n=1 Tax=Elysia chlorotica TaxID=188477 RepID=A0A433TKA4_ELYCH|nr:hypothetical protein EGW08_010218 [Elysia chlorotica]